MPRLRVAIPGILVSAVLLLWFFKYRVPAVSRDPSIVEIGFMGPGGPVAGAFDDVVRAFERKSLEAHRKDPSKPIYKIISGQDAAYDMTGDPTRFLISVAGGSPPDVVKFDRYAIAQWASRNAFEPLDKYLARDHATSSASAIRSEDFYGNVWAEATYGGNLYAIPADVDARALYYNKSRLRRAGLVDPATGEARPPRTWKELREYNIKLTQQDEFGRLSSVGFAPNYGNSWLYIFAWMAGGEFLSPDGRTCIMNQPPVVRALDFMRTMYDDLGGYKHVEAFRSSFQGGYLDPFLVGKISMKIDASPTLTFLAQYGHDLDFGVAPPPMPEDRLEAGADMVSWSGGFAFAIPYNAKHKEAAWEFIQFATSDEGFRLFAEGEREISEGLGYPYVPTFTPKPLLNEELMNRYVFSNSRLPNRLKEGAQVFLDLIPKARFRPVTPVGQLMWTQQVAAMEEALYHRKTSQQALDYARQVVQRDLDKVHAPPQGFLIKWQWFVAGYVLLLVAVIAGVYCWDTKPRFRRRLARMVGYKGKVGIGDVIEGSQGGYFRSQWRGGLLCTMPWFIGFTVFGGGPLLFSVLMSFCDYDVLSPPRFIGLTNYRILFTEDELAPKAFFNTVFMLLRVPINLTAGLMLALLLNMKLKGMPVFRSIFYLPAVMPAVATFILWIWIFNPVSGPLNALLGRFGIMGPNWLQDAHWAKPSIMLMSLWGVGGGMIIWLAGLRNINPQLYEAASIDGAGTVRQFFSITLPQLSPYIFFNMIMSLIDGFKIFDEAFIMTRGGPVNSTLFYVYHLFNNAFRFGHMGYASAMAWMMFLCIIGFTVFQMRVARKWVHYETE